MQVPRSPYQKLSPSWVAICATLVTLLAFLLRVASLNHGVGTHPDERHIIMVTTALSLADMNPHSFAYGSLPFYLLWGVGQLGHLLLNVPFTYDSAFIVGRLLAAVLGSLTVLIVFRCVFQRTGSLAAAVIAGLFLGLNRFHIQLSRYFTVDILLAFLVLLAITVLFSIAVRIRASDYLKFSVLFGLALATKISALFLLAPFLVAALWGLRSTRSFSSGVAWAQIFAVLPIAALVWFGAAPYTLLDWSTFLHHSREQITMTQGLWRPPYTIQYATTTPYLYPLQQMFQTTFGPPAFILAAFAFVVGLLRALRKGDALSAVVVVAMLGLFGATGGLFVKFPRYLLPLYPLAALLVGFLVASVRPLPLLRRLVWSASVAVLGTMFVAALAFARIYTVPHGYEIASQWIVNNIPAGSTLLGVHWDDRLPVAVPGVHLPSLRYRYEGSEHELAIYEADTPEKSRVMAERLARSDYLIFPTARTYAPLARLPEEFPNTNRMLTALFRETLGYRLVQSVKVTPAIAGITYPDDFADESFTVYDHPKILIFKNVAHLPADQLVAIFQQGTLGTPLLTAEAMLATTSAGHLPEAYPPSSWVGLLIWIVILEILAWAAVPWLVLLFRTMPDRALGCSKILGPVLFALGVWSFAWYSGRAISVGELRSLFALVALGSLGLGLWLHWSRRIPLGAELMPHIARVEGLFLGGMVLAAAVRSFAPEIFWGEKPMDFTFLNYFIRLDSLPPEDPWAAGRGMNYYYVGPYLIALLIKIAGVTPAIGYSLGLAAIVGWLLAASYSLLFLLIGRRVVAVWGSILVMIGSNFEVLRLWLWDRREANFDLFWASSRVLTSPAITEYPVWSFLFGDLHAHVITLPVVVALLALCCGELRRRVEVVLPLVLIGFLWGSLLGLNTWDFIGVAVVIGCLWLVRLSELIRHGDESPLRAIGRWFGEVAVIGLAGFAAAIPWLGLSKTDTPIGYGWVRAEFSTIGQVSAHLGLWLSLIFVSAVVLVISWRLWRMAVWRWLLVLLAGAMPIVAVVASVATGTAEVPVALPLLFSALMVFGAWFMVVPKVSLEVRATGALLLAGALIAAGAELAFLMDRMNTIFKFYQLVWVALGVSGVALYAQVRRITGDQGLQRRRAVLGFVAGVVVVLSLSASLVNGSIMATFHRVPGVRPTLDGARYLESSDPPLAILVSWLNRNVVGTPTILEAVGNSYGAYTRIAMFTGLPTVIGWDHHVWQRGTPRAEIEARRAAVETIYRTDDMTSALRLIKTYGVRWIVIGQLERDTYRGSGTIKFARFPEFFRARFQNGKDIIYEVAGPLTVAPAPGVAR